MSWEFAAFVVSTLVVAYPFWGSIVHGDPWRWVFKSDDA